MSMADCLKCINRNFAINDVCEKAEKHAKKTGENMVVYFNDDGMPECNTE